MKLFKSLFSIIIVSVVALCMSVPAFADSATYSIEIPDGFTSFEAQGQDAAWKNADGSIIINLAITENVSNVKVNPLDAGQSYMTLLENEMRASVVSTDKFSGEVVAISSKLMELDGHDAIRVSMHSKYVFEDGEMNVYQLCYLFETQNYIHSFVVTGDSDVSEFGDKLIKTVQINDEAIPLRSADENDSGFLDFLLGGGIIGGAIKGAVIGAIVGLVLALINKSGKKKKVQQSEQEAPCDEQPTNEPEEAHATEDKE